MFIKVVQTWTDGPRGLYRQNASIVCHHLVQILIADGSLRHSLGTRKNALSLSTQPEKHIFCVVLLCRILLPGRLVHYSVRNQRSFLGCIGLLLSIQPDRVTVIRELWRHFNFMYIQKEFLCKSRMFK